MKVAVIPARGGSKRIPGKNIRDFLGKPIIAYSIEAAQACGIFDEVMVSTDDPAIAEVASGLGASVPFMRPDGIADDFAPIIDVLKNVADWYHGQQNPLGYLCCIYATAPFVAPADLRKGYEALADSNMGSSMSVAKFTYPIQRALEVADGGALQMIDKTHLLTRSQDLPEAYMDAAQFIWTRPDALLQCRTSLFERGVMPVVIPTKRVQDIDTLEDWSRAELMFRALAEERAP